jgi:hypothetical protein
MFDLDRFRYALSESVTVNRQTNSLSSAFFVTVLICVMDLLHKDAALYAARS